VPDQLNAATLLGDVTEGDFQLSARVTAGFASTFDAGVLLLWLDERRWAKLCFEFSPAGEPTSRDKIGFEGQSPTGDGCSVTFDEIRFLPERLADLRDGS
jgi:regulation of enolase protein 1 (concanavalin A-like superfamily)